jgi:hypothetical protein
MHRSKPSQTNKDPNRPHSGNTIPFHILSPKDGVGESISQGPTDISSTSTSSLLHHSNLNLKNNNQTSKILERTKNFDDALQAIKKPHNSKNPNHSNPNPNSLMPSSTTLSSSSNNRINSISSASAQFPSPSSSSDTSPANIGSQLETRLSAVNSSIAELRSLISHHLPLKCDEYGTFIKFPFVYKVTFYLNLYLCD